MAISCLLNAKLFFAGSTQQMFQVVFANLTENATM